MITITIMITNMIITTFTITFIAITEHEDEDDVLDGARGVCVAIKCFLLVFEAIWFKF